MVFLKPLFEYYIKDKEVVNKHEEWVAAWEVVEKHNIVLLKLVATPEEARSVLPNSLKTEIVITYNLREWAHFMNLRWFGTTGKPHPQMKEVANMIREDMVERYPFICGECMQLL